MCACNKNRSLTRETAPADRDHFTPYGDISAVADVAYPSASVSPDRIPVTHGAEGRQRVRFDGRRFLYTY